VMDGVMFVSDDEWAWGWRNEAGPPIVNRNRRPWLTVVVCCRVLSTAMKCFHAIQRDIRSRCPAEMSTDYRRHYVEPLVEQTRRVVLARCTMTAPYEQYFRGSATTTTPGECRTYLSVLSSLSVIALVFARWRC